jgi:hypothetical protein
MHWFPRITSLSIVLYAQVGSTQEVECQGSMPSAVRPSCVHQQEIVRRVLARPVSDCSVRRSGMLPLHSSSFEWTRSSGPTLSFVIESQTVALDVFSRAAIDIEGRSTQLCWSARNQTRSRVEFDIDYVVDGPSENSMNDMFELAAGEESQPGNFFTCSGMGYSGSRNAVRYDLTVTDMDCRRANERARAQWERLRSDTQADLDRCLTRVTVWESSRDECARRRRELQSRQRGGRPRRELVLQSNASGSSGEETPVFSPPRTRNAVETAERPPARDRTTSTSQRTPDRRHSASRIRCPEGMEAFAGGSYMMGYPNGMRQEYNPNIPREWFVGQREVVVLPFCFSRDLVTGGAYEECVDAGRCPAQGDPRYDRRTEFRRGGFPNNPICDVTYQAAQSYCAFRGWRLPTEAEWEYVASEGGTRTRYWNGSALDFNAITSNTLSRPIHSHPQLDTQQGIHDLFTVNQFVAESPEVGVAPRVSRVVRGMCGDLTVHCRGVSDDYIIRTYSTFRCGANPL